MWKGENVVKRKNCKRCGKNVNKSWNCQIISAEWFLINNLKITSNSTQQCANKIFLFVYNYFYRSSHKLIIIFIIEWTWRHRKSTKKAFHNCIHITFNYQFTKISNEWEKKLISDDRHKGWKKFHHSIWTWK